MYITIRQAEENDFDYVLKNPLEKGISKYSRFPLTEFSFTGLVDGKIVGMGGILILWEGVGEIWLILTEDVLNYKISAFKCLKRMFEIIIQNSKFNRLQAVIKTDFSQAIKLAEAIGFVKQKDGLMRKYLPDGTDCFLYEKIFD